MRGYIIRKFLDYRLAPTAIAGFFAYLFANFPVEVDNFGICRFDDPFFDGVYKGEDVVKVLRGCCFCCSCIVLPPSTSLLSVDKFYGSISSLRGKINLPVTGIAARRV
jgi:hypothetical protein